MQAFYSPVPASIKSANATKTQRTKLSHETPATQPSHRHQSQIRYREPLHSLSHDASVSAISSVDPHQPNKGTMNEDLENILQTPRRGRRLAGVHMGWQSPSAAPTTSSQLIEGARLTTSAATVPRAARAYTRPLLQDHQWENAGASLSVTPKKRRPPSADAALSESPTLRKSSLAHAQPRGKRVPYLLDDQGFASAAVLASPQGGRSLQDDPLHVAASPSFVARPPAQPRCDHLEAFKNRNTKPCRDGQADSVDQSNLPTLVAVEVQGMGRVAVGRDVALQLGALTAQEVKDSAAQAQCTSSSDTSKAGSTFTYAPSGHASSSSAPTSVTAHSHMSEYTDPSPSFSLASHFPASEDGSPSLNRLRSSPLLSQSKQRSSGLDADLMRKVRAFKGKIVSRTVDQKLEAQNGQSLSSYSSPRLRIVTQPLQKDDGLPALQWPDSLSGPWAAAEISAVTQDDSRLDIIARWLKLDDDASWTDVDLNQEHTHRPQRHPMVAKILRDRARKEAIDAAKLLGLRSAAQPARRGKKKGRKTQKERNHLLRQKEDRAQRINSRGRNSLSQFKVKASRGRDRLANYAPSAHSSGGRTDASVLDCLCGSSREDEPMVQCDACHRWFHMRCAGVDHDDDLEESWFCAGCERESDAAQAAFSRRGLIVPPQVFSPQSSHAFSQAPSTGGTFSISTPGASDGLMAFPRTFASHAGVGTPSSRDAGTSRLSQGLSVPVFTHPPTESPSSIIGARSGSGLPISSALALAPSPQIDSAETLEGLSAERRQAGLGRARASRIGWHAMEPSSPLDRKSISTYDSTVDPPRSARWRVSSSHGTKHQLSHSRGRGRNSSPDGSSEIEERAGSSVAFSPGIFSNLSRSEWDLASLHARRSQHSSHPSGSRTRTPSPTRPPQQAYGTTPSRLGTRYGATSASRDGGFGRRQGEDGEIRDSDDVFSTPSRHLPGSAWWGSRHPAATTPSKEAGVPAHAGLQTPSRSSRRRESSAWGLGLATPGGSRDLLFGAHGTDASGGNYSAGLPSLVFSSGGALGEEGIEFPAAHWNSGGSPCRSARAVNNPRVRQLSSNVSMTPVSLRSHTFTSSVRSSSRIREESQDPEKADPPSSSPYPRTPSVDYGHHHMTAKGISSTPGSPTPNKNRLGTSFAGGTRKAGLALSEAVRGSGNQQQHYQQRTGNAVLKHNASAAGQTGAGAARLRQVSSSGADIAHFGLGLDLDEILDYF